MKKIKYINSKKLINFWMKFGYLFPEQIPLTKEIKRITEYSRLSQSLSNEFDLKHLNSFHGNFFAIRIDLDSIIFPYFIDLANSQKFIDHLSKLFDIGSAGFSNISHLREILHARSIFSPINIGTIYNRNSVKEFRVAEDSVRLNLDKRVEKIQVSVATVSSNVFAVNFRCFFIKDETTAISNFFIENKNDYQRIDSLSFNYESSRVVTIPAEVRIFSLIENLIDQLQDIFEKLKIVNTFIMERPLTFNRNRSRIPIFILKSHHKEIFNDDNRKNFSSRVLLRSIGIGTVYYRSINSTVFQFSSPSPRDEDRTNRILVKESPYKPVTGSVLSEYLILAVKIIYLEHAKRIIYTAETTIDNTIGYKYLLKNNYNIYVLFNTLQSMQLKSEFVDSYLVRQFSQLSGAKNSLDRLPDFQAKMYFEGINKEISELSIRCENIINTLNKIRDETNVNYNYKIQRQLKILTTFSVVFGAVSITVGILSILSSEDTFSLTGFLDLIKSFGNLF